MVKEVTSSTKQTAPGTRSGDLFSDLRTEMHQLFDDFLGRRLPSFPSFISGSASVVPAVDVKEDEKALHIDVELPGMEEKDISVSIRDGILTVKGEKKSERDEEKDNYHLSERSYGSFQRSFQLPDTADEENISAQGEKGVLKINVPKKAEAVKPARQISVGKS